MVFVSGAFGFLIAANYSLTCIILVELISLDRFTNAYGLLLLVQGVANLVGPPLGGNTEISKQLKQLIMYSFSRLALRHNRHLRLVLLPCRSLHRAIRTDVDHFTVDETLQTFHYWKASFVGNINKGCFTSTQSRSESNILRLSAIFWYSSVPKICELFKKNNWLFRKCTALTNRYHNGFCCDNFRYR